MFSGFFSQAFIYLAAAVLAVPVIIGPFMLGLVGQESQDVMHFAEFGVVLMLFLVGLELEPAVLWRMRVPILGLGGAQVVLSGLALAAVAQLLGLPWQSAIAVGLILALSSTAIVLQTLKEKGWMGTNAGSSAFSVLLFQDIAVIPVLAILPFLAIAPPLQEVATGPHPATDANWPAAARVFLLLGVVAGIVLAGRFLMRPVFRWIASTRSVELFIATALMLVVGITLATEFVGLSPALGTFLAGVVLAESEFRHELESNIEPFKGLLLGLFFISVGASIDFTIVTGQPVIVAGLVLGLIAVKLAVLLALGRVFGFRLADNLMFAFLLAQGGEFAFLLFSFATRNGVLDAGLSNLLIVVVVITMMLTPLLVIAYERLVRPRFVDCASSPEEPDIEAPPSRVIIAGFGRFGQVVSRLLHADGIQATLLDHDAGRIEVSGRFGYKVFYGDASRVQLLQSAGAGEAQLLVVAIDDRDKAVTMVETARRFFPQLKVLARAYDRPHAYRLMEAGADVVTRETFGSALILGEEALRSLGYEDARAHRLMRIFKRHDEEGLKKLYDVWGDDQAYGLRVRRRIEELEKVLKDDTAEEEDLFREAWEKIRGVESRRPFPED
jgi:glutathione-regulated potassium-efflux system ancillary protein KefC